jgi:hypothetical protein
VVGRQLSAEKNACTRQLCVASLCSQPHLFKRQRDDLRCTPQAQRTQNLEPRHYTLLDAGPHQEEGEDKGYEERGCLQHVCSAVRCHVCKLPGSAASALFLSL